MLQLATRQVFHQAWRYTMRVKGDLLVICERLMTFYLDTVTF